MSSRYKSGSDHDGLCRNCRLLLFDDKAHGGFEAFEAERNSSYLLFSEDDTGRIFPTNYEFEDDLPDLPALAESATLGCDCCSALRNAILKSKLTMLGETSRIKLKMSYVWKNPLGSRPGDHLVPFEGLVAAYLRINCISGNSENDISRSVISFDIDSTSAPCMEWLRLKASPSGSPLSPENIKWINSRLPHLEERSDGTYLPTRLLNVGTADASGSSVRLELTTSMSAEHQSLIKYAALSYCWGAEQASKKQFCTTQSTLARRLFSIELSETSFVIQNAVEVCRALGIKYLWVDAVCIVQDDAVDWECEASQMNEVYRNALITICALASNSCDRPFLRQRDCGINLPFSSQIKGGIFGHFTLRYSQFYDVLPNHFTTDTILQDCEDSDWKRRAWTFQEFNLSKHLLLFGKRRLHIVSESGSQAEGEREQEDAISTPLIHLQTTTNGIKNMGHDMLCFEWMKIVEEYSDRQITYAKDRLPALAGLATLFGTLLSEKDEYLHGLWRRNLHQQLFWRVFEQQDLSLVERVAELSAAPHDGLSAPPSWSWANQHKYVEFGLLALHARLMSYSNCTPEFSSVVFNPAHCPASEGRQCCPSLDIMSRIVVVGNFMIRRSWLENCTSPLCLLIENNGAYMADCALDCYDPGTEEEGFTDPDLSLLLVGSCLDDNYNEEEDWEDVEDNDDGTWEHDEEQHEGDTSSSSRPARYMYGLMICPKTKTIEDTDDVMREYYRVGIFYSNTGKRGTLGDIFDGCEPRVVRLL